MSSKRILGLLSVVFGALIAMLGVWALLSAPRFTIAQPIIALVGAGFVALGVVALRSASSTPQQAPAAPTGSTSASSVGGVFAVLLVALWGWYYFGGGLEQRANQTLQEIHDKVATDAVDKYGIAKRNGSPIDICVQAGFVTAAYLQAKDEANYQRWKQTEKTDCSKAGIEK